MLVLDKEKLFLHFKGNEQIMYKFLARFIEERPKNIKSLTEFIKNDDVKNVEIMSHTLKGHFANFFCEPAQKICQQIESTARQGSVGACEILMEQLLEVSNGVIYEVNAIINSNSKSA